MKNFYNDKSDIVSQAIDGLIASSGGTLRRFDSASHARVVVRSDWDKSKVAIISGGGSGHEPAHAGLVGPNLLTAAVCGGVYASPSVDAVLLAIMETAGSKGCLLVIKNYTGDRLNFGLAAEKAKSMGYKVEMVIVGDDIAIPDAVQPRGIAGAVFIHKVAGYLSENDNSLEKIYETVSAMNGNIRSLGVARDTCTVPGNEKQSRIKDDEVEVGLGIHGEPGISVDNFTNCSDLMNVFTKRLVPHLDQNKRYLALFNNLGGLNGLECSILFNEFKKSDIGAMTDFVVGPTPIMTALDMPGFSISMVPVEENYRDALLADVICNAYPTVQPMVETETITPATLDDEKKFLPSDDQQVRAIIETIIQTCLESEADLNELDAKVGDGDTGTTFAAAARTVRTELDNLPLANGSDLLAVLSEFKAKSMGGSSGVLFAILFANASEAYKANNDWGLALSAGLDAMKKYGGADLGDRTLIDSLEPALVTIVNGGNLAAAAVQARKGADGTASMMSAKAGRSSYLDARSLDGFADPGAEGIARIFEAISK